MDYNKAFNVGSIQLEPRLQEYIRRKRFNEENDIEPPIPEEKEFDISSHDLKVIKQYRSSTKPVYTPKRLARDPNFIKPKSNGFNSTNYDEEFKKDPRYQRILKKAQSHRDAQKKIRNFDGIDQEYTIFHQSNPYDNDQGDKQKMSKPYDDPINRDIENEMNYDNNFMMDSRELVLGPMRPIRKNNNKLLSKCSNNNESTYHHPPKISYHQSRPIINGRMEHSRDVNDIIGNIDSYNKHLNNTYSYVNYDADLDTHTITPGSRTETKREKASTYQSVPYGYGNGLPNVSLEDSLRGGVRDSSKKNGWI